jgi:predicted lipoprotein with Yx(FWY)xxD motif
MNQYTKIIAGVIIAVVVLYGGYRLYNHFTKAQPTAAPVVATPTNSPSMSPAALQNSVYKMMSDSKGASYLTDEKGMTLYTYSKDNIGVSNCLGTCITNWPAYGPTIAPTASLPGSFTVITRSDKTLQYAWKGMPLYYFVKDTKTGDVTGDGVGGFMLAK